MQENTVIKSECGIYQYVEVIHFDEGDKGACTILGLNPQSIEDAKTKKAKDNCIQYAKNNGFSSLIFVNLYAALNIDPTLLPKIPKTVGDDNDKWLLKAAEDSEFIIGAWGDYPRIKNRVYAVLKLLDQYDIYAIQTNRNGSPSHPLAWKKKAAKLYRRGRPDVGKVAS